MLRPCAAVCSVLSQLRASARKISPVRATAFDRLRAQSGLAAGETVAVFGCGRGGLSAIMTDRAIAAEVIAIDGSAAALSGPMSRPSAPMGWPSLWTLWGVRIQSAPRSVLWLRWGGMCGSVC